MAKLVNAKPLEIKCRFSLRYYTTLYRFESCPDYKQKTMSKERKRKVLDLPSEVVKHYQLKAIEQDKSVKKILEEVLIKAAKIGE